jgi:nucleotide-binding universal stress UspA family protein
LKTPLARRYPNNWKGANSKPAHRQGPAGNIVDEAKALKSDPIVIGARARHFATTHALAGVLGRVLVDDPCPVLTTSTYE